MAKKLVKKKPVKAKRLPIVGKWLGCGAYKDCYELGKSRVALLSKEYEEYTFKKDYQLLKKLEKLKLPSVKARFGKVMKGRRIRNAIILPKYDHGGVRVSGHQTDKIKKEHHKQLVKIYKGIKKHKMVMSDMQFLIRDGAKPEIVLTDPNYIDFDIDPRNNYNLSDLEYYFKLKGVRYK